MLSEAQIDLAGLRCLIVEDVSILAETERRLLSRLGAQVLVAESVQEARRALATEPFDVLIVDLGLPDGDGSDVILAALEASPHIAVLVVSGLRDRGRNLDLQAMGAVVMEKDALAEYLPRAVVAARRKLAVRPLRPAAIATSDSLEKVPSPNPLDSLKRTEVSADSAVGRYASEHRLTEREHEVFALSFQGLADKDIGLALRISYSTVRAHWSRIVVKTGCESQRDVMRKFARCLAHALARAEQERDASGSRCGSHAPVHTVVHVLSPEGDTPDCPSRAAINRAI